MKKQLFLLLALLTPLASMAQQQLTVGDVTMTINPEKGARILSFQYKGQEMISQLKAPESFGSTFWTSPQKEWNWPPVKEFDKMPYQVEERDGSLILTSEVSPRLKCRVRKEFTTDKKDNAIVITYSIINEGDEERQVAPWEITRVENKGGVIFFDAPLDGITPADLMPFTAANGAVWYQPDEDLRRPTALAARSWRSRDTGLCQSWQDLHRTGVPGCLHRSQAPRTTQLDRPLASAALQR